MENNSFFLEKVNEIEQLASNPETEHQVLDLCEELAAQEDGLAKLIACSNQFKEPIIGRSISFILAQLSDSVDSITSLFVFQFITTFDDLKDESTLINCLTCIQRQVMYDHSVFWRSNQYRTLYQFLDYCLEQSILVKRIAIGAFSRMYEDDILEGFTNDELNALRVRLIRIANQYPEELNIEIQGIALFLNKR